MYFTKAACDAEYNKKGDWKSRKPIIKKTLSHNSIWKACLFEKDDIKFSNLRDELNILQFNYCIPGFPQSLLRNNLLGIRKGFNLFCVSRYRLGYFLIN